MEEILASIRRIIADDDAAKPVAKAAEPPPVKAPAVPAPAPRAAPPVERQVPPSPPPSPPPAATEAVTDQSDIDAMFAGAAEPATKAAAPAQPDILELTESMATAPEPSFQKIDGEPDVVFGETGEDGEEDESASQDTAPLTFASVGGGNRPLLSSSASSAVDSAFNTLAHTVLVQNARTLEDLVREMLRPMLKSWLDDNLPGLVERLVRAEIERVSRGRS
jgi:cell pole-organizing protein PopZ